MRDPGLRDRGAEIQVGIFVIIAAVALVGGVFWISSSPLRGPSMRIVGVTEDAGQITADSKVLLRGVEVGTVEDVGVNGQTAVVTMTLYAGGLADDTRGFIKPVGFLGQQLVELVPGVAATALAPGDTIVLGRTPDIMTVAAGLGDEAGVVLENLQSVISERLAGDIAEGAEAFALAMQEAQELLAAERETVASMIANIDSAAGHLSRLAGSGETDRIIARLDSLSARLAGAGENFAETAASMATITRRLEAGEGTLGKLMTEDELHDVLTETLNSFQAASEEATLLLRDIRERPDRYLQDVRVSVF